MWSAFEYQHKAEGKPNFPCRVVPNLDNDKYCGAPSGSHTILEIAICDECWEAVSDPALITEALKSRDQIRILGFPTESSGPPPTDPASQSAELGPLCEESEPG